MRIFRWVMGLASALVILLFAIFLLAGVIDEALGCGPGLSTVPSCTIAGIDIGQIMLLGAWFAMLLLPFLAFALVCWVAVEIVAWLRRRNGRMGGQPT
jgi:hypothetical protein